MKHIRSTLIALSIVAAAADVSAQVTTRDVQFFSEAVRCHATLFLPGGFSSESKASAVVLAPGAGQTAATLEKYARRLADKGIVAMAIDYRGWGKSGGFVYLAEPVRTDDRLRFSQHTAKVLIKRKRILPDHQVLDIRNAISFIQGEPGVDRTRIGVWGADLGGGHVITVAAIDARIKAAVAHAPVIAGRDAAPRSFLPSAADQAAAIRVARGPERPAAAPATAPPNDVESKLAIAEYHPFQLADQIPERVAVLFVVAEKDTIVNNEANAVAASKRLKGPTTVTTIPGAAHAISTPSAADAAADAAAEWFAKYL